jgi:ribonuclease Y
MNLVWNIVGAVVCAIAGAGVGAMILNSKNRQREEARRRETTAELEKTRASAQQEIAQIRAQTDHAAAARRQELTDYERRLTERESLLNTQLARVIQTEGELKQQREMLDRKNTELEQGQTDLHRLTELRRAQLEKLSSISGEQARAQFLKEIEQESLADAANISRHILEDAKAHAEEKARKVIVTAIQRYAGNQTFESSSATIILESPELKGRIIGREGRNIRAFENATGVTVLIDDEPGAVILSAFDPVWVLRPLDPNNGTPFRDALGRFLLFSCVYGLSISGLGALLHLRFDRLMGRA